MKGDSKWSTLQIVFTIMCLNGLFSHSHPVDAEHARRTALFHLVISVIGLLGLIGVQITKRHAPTVAGGTLDPAPNPNDSRCLSVTYNSTRADQWRCNLYVLTHRWQTMATLVILPLFWSIVAYGFQASHPNTAWGEIALIWIGWYGFLLGVLWFQILQRLPRKDSERICTTIIRPEGFVDITPSKSRFVPWSAITDLREHDGDLYLWRGAADGNFIPRTAFVNNGSAREYFQTAYNAWKGRDVQWPERTAVPATPIPYDPTVWPPPPQRF